MLSPFYSSCIQVSSINHTQPLRNLTKCKKNGDTWGDTDISGESSQVQGICNAVWTDDVKTAYKAFVDSQNA